MGEAWLTDFPTNTNTSYVYKNNQPNMVDKIRAIKVNTFNSDET